MWLPATKENSHFLCDVQSETAFMQTIKGKESHAERFTSGPLGITVTKGWVLNKHHATAIDDFHTLGSEAAIRGPPQCFGSALQNV